MNGFSPGQKATLRVLGISIPLAALLFLALGGWFDSYHGRAVSWRPLSQEQAEDGMRQVLVIRPNDDREEHTLPPGASRGLPLERNALPPINIPEDAPVIHKDPFGFSVQVGESTYSTLSPTALLLPMLAVILAVLIRNLVTTGGAFRMDVVPGEDILPGVTQNASGQPAPVKKSARSKQGPPPPKRGKKGKRRR